TTCPRCTATTGTRGSAPTCRTRRWTSVGWPHPRSTSSTRDSRRSDAPYDARPMADLPLTIPQLVARAAERFGDLEAVVDGDVRLSFREFANEIDRAAPALIPTHLQPPHPVPISP